MKPIGILYATCEGQTKRIAEYIAAPLRVRGVTSDIRNIGAGPQPQLADYSAVILAASVHPGKHEPEMLEFVKRHSADLEWFARSIRLRTNWAALERFVDLFLKDIEGDAERKAS